MKHFLGIDIGGTSIKYGIGNLQQGLLSFASIPTPANDIASFQSSIHDLIERQCHDSGYSISAIGIASPGTIERESGLIRGMNPNLKFWTNLSPLMLCPQDYSERCFFDNDANLMALAEAQGRSGHILGITVGTGIGSGFVIDGVIYHGARGFGMELGHTCIVPNGALCNCGLQGCLEAYSSVTAITRAVTKIDSKLKGLSLVDLIRISGTREELSQLISEAENYLVQALANAIITLDPDTIILGGGAMEAGLYSIEEMRSKLNLRLPLVNHHTGLEIARLGNRAGVMGAVILAEQGIL